MNPKNLYTKSTLALVISVFIIVFGLFSCSQEPIFWSIEKEIKLKEPTIRNIIYSIIEYPQNSGTLYAANGRINVKQNGIGDWSTFWSGAFVIRLASDTNGMYAYTQAPVPNTTDSKYTLYFAAYDSTSNTLGVMTKVTTLPHKPTDGATIFDNQDPVDATRRAFITLHDGNAYKVYKLNGTGALGTAETLPLDITHPIAAAKLGATTVFSNFRGIVANTAGDRLFRLNGGTVQEYDNSVTPAVWKYDVGGLSSNSNTNAIAFYTRGTQQFLLVGTTSGARAIQIAPTIGGFSELADVGLGSNASGALNGSYIFSGGMYVFGQNIYAAAVNRYYGDRNGLWGYYPSAGVWNRE